MRRDVAALVMAASIAASGCNGTTPAPARPIAARSIERVQIRSRPVQRPGELGENSASSPPKGSRVEVHEHFILVTPPGGATVLSPHGWYTDLAFKADPTP